MLEGSGYEVDLRENHVVAEAQDHELDLVILALHRKQLDEAAAYSERLRTQKPNLPVLLLLDTGVFVPHGTLSRSVETGYSLEFMRDVAQMLAGTPNVRELAQK